MDKVVYGHFKDKGYGYRLLRKTLFDNEIRDYHIGAYGFESESAAIDDAKRRLREEINPDAIFTWVIQCYSFKINGRNEETTSSIVMDKGSFRIIEQEGVF